MLWYVVVSHGFHGAGARRPGDKFRIVRSTARSVAAPATVLYLWRPEHCELAASVLRGDEPSTPQPKVSALPN